MQCPICKGKMQKIKDRISQDKVGFEAYKCSSCGEELMNMSQLKSLAAKYRKLRHARPVRFAKWGNSIAVRIPKDFVNDFKIGDGKEGLMTKDKESIRITVT